MKTLDLNQMEILSGSNAENLCAFAIGLGGVLAVPTGGWSLVGSFMVCATSAY